MSRGSWGRQRGAAAVEFALVLVPLLLLIFGMVDFGFGYFKKVSDTQGAREAARHASLLVNASPSQAKTWVCDAEGLSASACGSEPITVSVTPCPGTSAGAAPSNAIIGVSRSYSLIVPLPVPGFPSAITISSEAREQCEV